MAVTLGTYGDNSSAGWTTITASGDSRIVYVSSSGGSSGNDGLSSGAPKQTLAQGMALLRDGFPDWLLLKKGDTWTDEVFGQLNKSGRSATEPMVISTYGSGARPLIKTNPTVSSGLVLYTQGDDGTGSYFALTGIEFYAYTRDPASPSYNSGTTSTSHICIRFLNANPWMLIEDCKFNYFSENLNIAPFSPSTFNGSIYIRRNVIVHATAGQGLISAGTNNMVIEENVFDHNGWDETISGEGPNIFNHNIYLNEKGPGNTGTNQPATIRGNFFSRDASGNQFRSGGVIDNNIFTDSPYGNNFGQPFAGVTSTITNNVYLKQIDLTSNGNTVSAYPMLNSTTQYLGKNLHQAGATISGNILAHKGSIPGGGGGGIYLDPGQHQIAISDNIIYDFQTPYITLANGAVLTFSNLTGGSGGANGTYTDVTMTGGSGSSLKANITVSGGAVTAVALGDNDTTTYSPGTGYAVNDTVSASSGNIGGVTGFSIKVATVSVNTSTGNTIDGVGYPDASRTVDTYDSSVLGGAGTLAHFLTLAYAQSKDNWDSRLTANAVNTYIRAGFGIGLTRCGRSWLGRF